MDEEFADIGEYGKYNAPFLAVASSASLCLSSIFLGIAESANEIAVTAIMGREGGARDSMNQVSVAENEIDLATTRAVLERSAQSFDDFYQTDETVKKAPGIEYSTETAFKLIKNSAVAKKFVMETSGVIVDRAIMLYGGGGFLANNTLARLYRDVRAGPLMQPWARNQAIEFIGKVALGLDPNDE